MVEDHKGELGAQEEGGMSFFSRGSLRPLRNRSRNEELRKG